MNIKEAKITSSLCTIPFTQKQSAIRQIFNMSITTNDQSKNNKNIIVYNNNVYFKQIKDNQDQINTMLTNIFNNTEEGDLRLNQENTRKINMKENIQKSRKLNIKNYEYNDKKTFEQIFIPCINCNNLISYDDIGDIIICNIRKAFS